jgi:hypothetical protein
VKKNTEIQKYDDCFSRVNEEEVYGEEIEPT